MTHTRTGLPSGLAALADEIHADNIKAGWWKTDAYGRTLPRNIGELLALVHSEISEADVGYAIRGYDDKLPHRPAHEVELADVAIRVLDILGYYGRARNLSDRLTYRPIYFPRAVSLMHCTTTRALEGFRKGDDDAGCDALNDLLSLVDCTALTNRMDLSGAIEEKRRYNAERLDHKREARSAVGGKRF